MRSEGVGRPNRHLIARAPKSPATASEMMLAEVKQIPGEATAFPRGFFVDPCRLRVALFLVTRSVSEENRPCSRTWRTRGESLAAILNCPQAQAGRCSAVPEAGFRRSAVVGAARAAAPLLVTRSVSEENRRCSSNWPTLPVMVFHGNQKRNLKNCRAVALGGLHRSSGGLLAATGLSETPQIAIMRWHATTWGCGGTGRRARFRF